MARNETAIIKAKLIPTARGLLHMPVVCQPVSLSLLLRAGDEVSKMEKS